jgi:DNA replication protein DnaC
VETEQQERTRRSLERRLARSRIGRFTPMTEFDWSWPKHVDRPAIEAALRLDFLSEARNVVLVAPQGLGKTMIAQNLAHAAVLAGSHVLFTTAAQLLLDLGSLESARSLARRLNHYASAACSSSMKSGTCPTTDAPPISSFRSSAAGTSSAVSCY